MIILKQPANEFTKNYAPGSTERDEIKAELTRQQNLRVEIPCIIGGKEIRTGKLKSIIAPHDHRKVLGSFHQGSEREIQSAIDAALKAKPAWEAMSPAERASIFLRAAELVAGPYRMLINAATMLGQSKNVFQAEIDSACELIDFFRFHAYFYQEIRNQQPISAPGVLNYMEYRPLEGFIAAITPFNFTAIAANLPTAPALVGNTVVWKPSDTQMLSAYYTLQVLREAGLPDGVINFVGADGPLFGKVITQSEDLGGIHFTGSTRTFQTLWKGVGERLEHYRSYPRLVGETGGKGFIVAHPSADIPSLSTALIRGSYEYQGQKCSAASRAYIPRSIWSKVEARVVEEIRGLKVGDVQDFSNFMNAVIDERSFKKISGYLDYAAHSNDIQILAGGKVSGERGYFVMPTLLLSKDPRSKVMVEEIFGPVLSLYVYDDSEWEDVLKICDESTPYALTGAVFSRDRQVIQAASCRLRNAAGNFYINDKPTGAVVGQQPFGGGRRSGTNDKSGSAAHLMRWLSVRTIKETWVPASTYSYPFMLSS